MIESHDGLGQVRIYQRGDQPLEVRLHGDTVWLRQDQMAELFGRDPTVIGRHIRSVFSDGELPLGSHVHHVQLARADRPAESFSLDVIISVGYRVKSVEGVRFRQWATTLLRECRTRDADTGSGLADIVSRYAKTFLLLQRYDEGLLTEPATQPGGLLPTPAEARTALAGLKSALIARGEATELFARERGDGLAALLGNLDQTAFGEPVYPSLEAKAAHLLYFVIKNHPFVDGNKRSGAYLFVDFLHRNNRLLDAGGQPGINDIGLAALALLVAESDPAQKETLIRLVMNMLAAA